MKAIDLTELSVNALLGCRDYWSQVPAVSDNVSRSDLSKLLGHFLTTPSATQLIEEKRWHTLASETIHYLSKFVPGLDSNYIEPLAVAFYQQYGAGSA